MIFRYNKKPRRQINLQLSSSLELIHKNFVTLPFSPRWLIGKMPTERIMPTVNELAKKDLLQSYPLLMERGKGLVAQAEHTIIVHKDSAEVTTVIE